MGGKTGRSRTALLIATACAFMASLGSAFAQTRSAVKATPITRFDAAVVKLSPDVPVSRKGGGCHGVDTKDFALLRLVPLGRCVFAQLTLREMIQSAYGLNRSIPADDAVSGGPAWVGTQPFEIEAVSDNSNRATEQQLTDMLKELLSERFSLELHHGTKSISGYVLRQSSAGSALKPRSNPTCSGAITFAPRKGEISGSNVRIGQLIGPLHRIVDADVIEATGLPGCYDIDIHWSGEIGTQAAPEGVNGPSIFAAVKEQLGLSLNVEKLSIDSIIIDSATKPSE